MATPSFFPAFNFRTIGLGMILAALFPVVAMAAPIEPFAEDWAEQFTVDAHGVGGDHFGNTVAISGAVALVSSPEAAVGGNSSQGKVLVYGQAADGSWSATQTLLASDGAAWNEFGWSMAIAGRTAVIGSINAKIGTNNSQGAAYVFTQGSDGVWTETQKLVADDGRAVDWFGSAVTVADDMIVVAAYGAHYSDQMGRGAVYVFTKDGGGSWTQTQQLVADDGAVGNYFGQAIARDGATLLVSAPGANVNGHHGQGAVYRFALSGGVWSQAQKIVIADGVENDQLGSALAVEGNTALIGAMWREGQHGVVYVYDGSGGTWNPVQQLSAPDVNPYMPPPDLGLPPTDNFGMTLALKNGAALVGASNVTIGDNAGQGAAYLFRKSSGAFTSTHTFTRYDGIVSPYVGAAVALDGNNVVAGAFGYTPDWSYYQQGAAHFYQREMRIPSTERQALIDLYDSTAGDGWWDMVGWLGAPGTECTWTGVTCDASGTTVVELSFDFTNMVGTLPASLNQLTNLTSLQIGDQSGLTGDFPSLAGMTQLQSIGIHDTAINGRLPSLAGLVNLQFATFLNNQFSGSIPPFGELPALTWFSASSNQLTGYVPSLAGLTSLSGFFVDGNQLSGTLPTPPASLGAYGAALCPNAFDHVESAPWDTITGITPWYRDCTTAADAIFHDGFDGAIP